MVKTAPSEAPAERKGDRNRRGTTLIIYRGLSEHNIILLKNSGGANMKTREEMLEYIYGQLENATDLEVEQYFWFFFAEEE